jgi:hypothetical protein
MDHGPVQKNAPPVLTIGDKLHALDILDQVLISIYGPPNSRVRRGPLSARTFLQFLDQVASEFLTHRVEAATLGPVRIIDLAVVLVRLRGREPRLVTILATPVAPRLKK